MSIDTTPMITFTVASGKKFGLTAAAKSAKSALGKRGLAEVGAEFDFSKIHPRVMQELVIAAVQTKLRTAVKKLNAEKATKEEIQKAMRDAFDLLVSGKKTARAASKRDPIKAEATKLLKAALKDFNDNSDDPEELDATAYTEKVKEMFAAHVRHAKGKGDETDEAIAAIVQGYLDIAKERLDQAAHIGGVLEKVLAGRGAPAERPTPTERVASEKAAAKKGKAAARA